MRSDIHEHELMTAWSRAISVRLMPIPGYFTKPFTGTPEMVSHPRVDAYIWHGENESGLMLHYPTRGVITDDMGAEFHEWRRDHGVELIDVLDGWRSGHKAMVMALPPRGIAWVQHPDLMEPTDEVRPHG